MTEIILVAISSVVIIGAMVYALIIYVQNEIKIQQKTINSLFGIVKRLEKKVDTLSGKVND